MNTPTKSPLGYGLSQTRSDAPVNLRVTDYPILRVIADRRFWEKRAELKRAAWNAERNERRA